MSVWTVAMAATTGLPPSLLGPYEPSGSGPGNEEGRRTSPGTSRADASDGTAGATLFLLLEVPAVSGVAMSGRGVTPSRFERT